VPAKRPTPLIIVIQLVLLCAVVVVAVLAAPSADWDPALLGLLLVFTVLSDLAAVETRSKLKTSGSFLALVLAMVLLGGSPAALLGALTILAGWLRWHEAPDKFLNNLVAYATIPLVCGLAFQGVTDAAGITADDTSFYTLVFATFLVALTINFATIASYSCYVTRSSFISKLRVVFLPLLPSELAAAMMAVGVAFIYHEVGLAAVVLFGIVLITFQYLLGALLLSQERAGELEVRTKQLASFQVGILSALLRTLDLRDQMTARHSAAVARYSQAIAKRAGYSSQEGELVHIAALLHDIGKFILPDRILKANVPLTDEDWMLIRRHPQQGARVVGSLDGYGPVAEVILAHHERIDGSGYPRGLRGAQIPELARIISVADTYDVMTARDSYRSPVSTYEAIEELRRVAGTQLEPRFVAIFIQLLEGRDVDFYPEEAADFERELALEARIMETADPAIRVSRFGPPDGGGEDELRTATGPDRQVAAG
jgi:putative nucleotidyltransferase with HDIG domain